jgi:hypothetical protein
VNLRTAKQIRKALAYRPHAEPTQYEKPQLHHIAHMPQYEKHTRVVRELGPPIVGLTPRVKQTCLRTAICAQPDGDHFEYDTFRERVISGVRRKVVSREVTKIIMSGDGKTARSLLWHLVKDPETGEQHHTPLTELVPVAKPARLRKGSPRQVYKLMKKLERNTGLENIFAGLVAETGVPA